ncbi:hypothetical protein [Pseudomonas sp. 8 R 14]|nr:hypothetical protein [Pseudomonas sp. 8 R 14]
MTISNAFTTFKPNKENNHYGRYQSIQYEKSQV